MLVVIYVHIIIPSALPILNMLAHKTLILYADPLLQLSKASLLGDRGGVH